MSTPTVSTIIPQIAALNASEKHHGGGRLLFELEVGPTVACYARLRLGEPSPERKAIAGKGEACSRVSLEFRVTAYFGQLSGEPAETGTRWQTR